MPEALRIALLGAESTGKTALAQVLAQELGALTGLRCTALPETLRLWCSAMGRTPRQDEQAVIAALHQRAIDEAAGLHDVLVCDTTPLMVAVYSHYVFNDTSLMPAALAWQARCATTLLMALDLPWVADGLQRDGEHVRAPVDALLRAALTTHKLPWSLVRGSGDARLQSAIDALAPLLRDHLRNHSRQHLRQHQRDRTPTTGLFTRLNQRNAEPAAAMWRCESCDDPACEHQLQMRQRSA